MTTPVKCDECDGRGWKIVTRRGHVATSFLGGAVSSQEDCLYCDGPEPIVEMFEWEVFTSEGVDRLGPCGTSSGQATSMDELRKALRRMEPQPALWGRITRRLYDFGMAPGDWSRQVIFHATVDLAGSVRFERRES
ncbi:hypothetical protein AB0F88_43410 [Streptosporangium sp. NPDC023963]|uniref:hypothetical protein n=1 Tax=Streptosporangium sp. NPDC023963 TaxID=3155608 RepID=UPI003438C3DA